MNENYLKIIGLPHHSSVKRAPMDPMDRAAQFAPFAALSGYDEAVRETGRETSEFIEIDEDKKRSINEALLLSLKNADSTHVITVVYFLRDPVKDGGEYVTFKGVLNRVDEISKRLIFKDGTVILLDDVYDVSCPEYEDFPWD